MSIWFWMPGPRAKFVKPVMFLTHEIGFCF